MDEDHQIPRFPEFLCQKLCLNLEIVVTVQRQAMNLAADHLFTDMPILAVARIEQQYL